MARDGCPRTFADFLRTACGLMKINSRLDDASQLNVSAPGAHVIVDPVCGEPARALDREAFLAALGCDAGAHVSAQRRRLRAKKARIEMSATAQALIGS